MANAFMTGPAGTAAVRAFAEEQRRQMQDEIRRLDAIIHDLTPIDRATGGASKDGLAEHLGLTEEIAEQEIGKLLRDGDVRYERRGGVTFLVEEPNV